MLHWRHILIRHGDRKRRKRRIVHKHLAVGFQIPCIERVCGTFLLDSVVSLKTYCNVWRVSKGEGKIRNQEQF